MSGTVATPVSSSVEISWVVSHATYTNIKGVENQYGGGAELLSAKKKIPITSQLNMARNVAAKYTST